MVEFKISIDSSPCPDCGVDTLHTDCPPEAPDFICSSCHQDRIRDDPEWAKESRIREYLSQSEVTEIPCHICENLIDRNRCFTGFDWQKKTLKHLCSVDCLREDGRRTLDRLSED